MQSCIISNCSLAANVGVNNGIVASNVICMCTVYYSTRCTDEAPYSGWNYTYNATSSSCRETRLANIDAALGSSSSTLFTNVPSIIIGGITVPMQSVYSIIFSNYSRKSSINDD